MMNKNPDFFVEGVWGHASLKSDHQFGNIFFVRKCLDSPALDSSDKTFSKVVLCFAATRLRLLLYNGTHSLWNRTRVTLEAFGHVINISCVPSILNL